MCTGLPGGRLERHAARAPSARGRRRRRLPLHLHPHLPDEARPPERAQDGVLELGPVRGLELRDAADAGADRASAYLLSIRFDHIC